MIETLLKYLGYTKTKEYTMDDVYYERTENQRIRAELLGKEELKKRVQKVIDTNIGDIEPTDELARAQYVATASNLYSEILERKLMQMIAQAREQLDSVWVDVPQGMTRNEYDHFIRGTSNCGKLLMDWGEMMKSEHSSNLIKTNE